MNGKLLTVEESADKLRLSRSTIYKWISQQEKGGNTPRLKIIKLGSRVLISESEIERLINENQR